jgi:hypothetical protein
MSGSEPVFEMTVAVSESPTMLDTPLTGLIDNTACGQKG